MWARVAKRFVASGGVGGGGTGTEVSSSRYAAGVRGFLQAGAWRAVSSVSAAHRAAGESRRLGVASPVLHFLAHPNPIFLDAAVGRVLQLGSKITRGGARVGAAGGGNLNRGVRGN